MKMTLLALMGVFSTSICAKTYFQGMMELDIFHSNAEAIVNTIESNSNLEEHATIDTQLGEDKDGNAIELAKNWSFDSLVCDDTEKACYFFNDGKWEGIVGKDAREVMYAILYNRYNKTRIMPDNVINAHRFRCKRHVSKDSKTGHRRHVCDFYYYGQTEVK